MQIALTNGDPMPVMEVGMLYRNLTAVVEAIAQLRHHEQSSMQRFVTGARGAALQVLLGHKDVLYIHVISVAPLREHKT